MILAQAQHAVTNIVRDLERIDQQLSQIAHAIQAPQFAEDSDEPLNLEAAVFSSIINTQKDELAATIQSLQKTAELDHEALATHIDAASTLTDILFPASEGSSQPTIFG